MGSSKSAVEKAAEEAAMLEYSQVGELENGEFTVHIGEEEGKYNFKSLIKLRESLAIVKEQTEAQIKEINDQLLLAMRASEQQKVKLWDGMKLEVRSGTSPSKLEATKLLERGVALEVIQASTTPGTPYQFVMVSKPKAGG